MFYRRAASLHVLHRECVMSFDKNEDGKMRWMDIIFYMWDRIKIQRKRGISLLYTLQSFSRVDKPLRRTLTYIYTLYFQLTAYIQLCAAAAFSLSWNLVNFYSEERVSLSPRVCIPAAARSLDFILFALFSLPLLLLQDAAGALNFFFFIAITRRQKSDVIVALLFFLCVHIHVVLQMRRRVMQFRASDGLTLMTVFIMRSYSLLTFC